jgi:hypothetical protein
MGGGFFQGRLEPLSSCFNGRFVRKDRPGMGPTDSDGYATEGYRIACGIPFLAFDDRGMTVGADHKQGRMGSRCKQHRSNLGDPRGTAAVNCDHSTASTVNFSGQLKQSFLGAMFTVGPDYMQTEQPTQEGEKIAAGVVGDHDGKGHTRCSSRPK